jgi:hypothetical protein
MGKQIAMLMNRTPLDRHAPPDGGNRPVEPGRAIDNGSRLPRLSDRPVAGARPPNGPAGAGLRPARRAVSSCPELTARAKKNASLIKRLSVRQVKVSR